MFDVYVCTCCDCDCHWAAAAAAAISLLTSERFVHSSKPSVHTLVVSDTLCSNRARSTGASKVSRGRGARHHRSGDSQSWRVMGGSKAAHPCIEQCHQLRRADLVGGLCSRPRREEPSPPPNWQTRPAPARRRRRGFSTQEHREGSLTVLGYFVHQGAPARGTAPHSKAVPALPEGLPLLHALCPDLQSSQCRRPVSRPCSRHTAARHSAPQRTMVVSSIVPDLISSCNSSMPTSSDGVPSPSVSYLLHRHVISCRVRSEPVTTTVCQPMQNSDMSSALTSISCRARSEASLQCCHLSTAVSLCADAGEPKHFRHLPKRRPIVHAFLPAISPHCPEHALSHQS
jgi:hypothetical protein